MITALKHDGGHVGTIDNPEDISDFVGTGCLIWVDVEGITAEDADRLIDEFDIEDLAQEDMRDGGRRTVGATAPRTKIENYEHHAFIAAYSGDLCPVNLLVGQDWVITFRQPNEAGQTWPVDTLLPRFETGDISTLGRLVWCVLDALVDDCLVTAGEIELRIETIEQSIFGSEPLERGATQRLQRQLFDIRRELVKLQHKVQPMEEVAAKLRDGDVMWVGTENAKEFENLRNHVLRATEQIAGHRELVSSEVDALLALASQRMNEVMKTMTGWGSILLGATLIAGIYGMNFTHMPELSWYFGYPSAILMMLLLTGTLYYFLKKRGSRRSCASADLQRQPLISGRWLQVRGRRRLGPQVRLDSGARSEFPAARASWRRRTCDTTIQAAIANPTEITQITVWTALNAPLRVSSFQMFQMRVTQT